MTLFIPVPAPGPVGCPWCGRSLQCPAGPGRPRRYCRRSCRQRDYEARRRAAELGLGEHELVVTRQERDAQNDRIAAFGDAVEIIERELADGADDTGHLLAELLVAARELTESKRP